MSSKTLVSFLSNQSRQQCRLHAFHTSQSLEVAATQYIVNIAEEAIKQRNAFHIVLAGGTTPRHVYALLRAQITDWNKWHIYFGDERCLPADHVERNSFMAAQTLLKDIDLPAKQVHIIPVELGAETAATEYAKILSKIDMFDLVILGLGEDGHTASLFPQREWGITPDAPATLAVYNAPKPPPERVSLTAKRLSQTRQLIFLVTGMAKKQALIDWHADKNIPAAAITPSCGVDIFLETQLLEAIQ